MWTSRNRAFATGSAGRLSRQKSIVRVGGATRAHPMGENARCRHVAGMRKSLIYWRAAVDENGHYSFAVPL
jgi:hypothetical protein